MTLRDFISAAGASTSRSCCLRQIHQRSGRLLQLISLVYDLSGFNREGVLAVGLPLKGEKNRVLSIGFQHFGDREFSGAIFRPLARQAVQIQLEPNPARLQYDRGVISPVSGQYFLVFLADQPQVVVSLFLGGLLFAPRSSVDTPGAGGRSRVRGRQALTQRIAR